MVLKLESLKVGTNLPELKQQVTQENIDLYARASGDFNPIHIDPEFARKTPLGGTIAHGMLILAYVSEFMTNSFEMAWLTGGSLNARFKAPARPGDLVTVTGEITKLQKEDRLTSIHCGILCQNQQGESIIVGEAQVRMRNDENSY